MNSSEKSLSGRIAANTRWAKTADRVAATAPAMAGLLAKFEREVDPEGVLAPELRRERAVQLRRAWMQRLARKSAIARRQRSEARKSEVAR
ncbi:hypothetical protein ACFYOT_26435 [Saccharothrix saharensis]|uniref:hypothetical protein n=1 Tax=Saccharothrix saharensis TaxID=571190 RepID=UPI0036923944